MYCLYLRKSRADLELEAKGELETLARHRKTLLDLAKKYNLPVGQVYEEIVSAETIDARPVVQKLLEEVEHGAWKGVLVMEVERLARGDTIDQGIVARAFKIGQVKIITPTKVYDPNNEFDEEYFEFGLFMSRREYKIINRRVQRGRIASAMEGKFLGSTPPFGYDKVHIIGDKGYTLTVNESEAPIVKYIFDRYIQGAGMPIIATELDSMGVLPRNVDKWSKSTIGDILSNPVYMGKLRWSYRIEQKYFDGGKVCKRRIINSSPIYVDGLHPGLIEDETFHKAQQVRKKNTKVTTKKNFFLQNPLSGIIFCTDCGQLMTRQGANKRTPYDFIRCPNRYCKNVSAPLHLVEYKIIDTLSRWITQYQLDLKKASEDQPTGLDGAHLKIAESLKKDIERLSKQLSKTYDLLEQGVYSIELFTDRNKELSTKILTAKEQLANAEQVAAEKARANDLKLKIPQNIYTLKAYSSAVTAEEKNTLLKDIVEKVEYYKEKANTRGKLNNDNFILHIYPKLLDTYI